tara:strand:+ start:282 stop:2573 length:2292 start_codon:yes stop_codon:yes gene_type:complete
MAKKAKKTDKKKTKKIIVKNVKTKSIPAKAGAKARVDQRGKIEVILPVDRSRGKYKPRQSKEDQIEERIKKLREERNQNSIQLGREQFASQAIGANNRRSGSINRSNVAEPEGGFTGGISDKNKLSKVQEELKDIKKLLEEQKEKKKVVNPRTPQPPQDAGQAAGQAAATRAPPPPPPLVSGQTPLRGQTIRPKQRRSFVADTVSNLLVPAVAATANILVEPAINTGLRAISEVQRQRDEQRKNVRQQKELQDAIQAENNRRDAEKKFKDRELQKRKEEERLEIQQETRKSVDRARQSYQNKERAKSDFTKEKERKVNSLIDDLMGGKKERNIEITVDEVKPLPQPQPEPQPEPKNENFKVGGDIEVPFKSQEELLEAFRNRPNQPEPLTDESDFEEEEPIKDRSRLVENIKKYQEEENKAEEKKTRRKSFIEAAEKEESKKKLREEAEKLRNLQVAGDQKLARELLVETARNKDRKVKESIEKQNEIDKLIQKEIDERRRLEKNTRRRVAEQVLNQTIQKSIDKALVRDDAENVAGDIVSGLVGRAVNESNIQNTPISAGRGRKQNDEGYYEKNISRQDIEQFRNTQDRIKRNRRGVMFFNLDGDRYTIKNIKNLDQFIREDIRQLQDRGVNQLEIDQATAILNILVADIKEEKRFTNLARTTGGTRQIVQSTRGRPRKNPVQEEQVGGGREQLIEAEDPPKPPEQAAAGAGRAEGRFVGSRNQAVQIREGFLREGANPEDDEIIRRRNEREKRDRDKDKKD